MKRVLGTVYIIAGLMLVVGYITLAYAQPALPSPPARPVPWGNLPLISVACGGCALRYFLKTK